MKFLFDNESFSFEALRAAAFAKYDGAELGEVIATAAHITDGDEDSWLTAWQATAERVEKHAETAAAAGHRVSAREAYLRASNYFRTAEFFRREDPDHDELAQTISARQRDTFVKAIALFDTPVEQIRIPYEGTTLPGYLYLVDGSGTPRPTVIYNNGYDSTAEESYFAIAAAALRRGYNVLAFDGPGTGAALRVQGLRLRPDWEAVITPVVDYALTRPEIDAHNISLFGYSLGGYLTARAAAFEHRLSALILDDGLFDFSSSHRSAMPPFVLDWVFDGRDDIANPVLRLAMQMSTQSRWGLNNGRWTMGVDSPADVIRCMRQYSLEGVVEQIDTPTLVLDAADDHFFKGQPEIVYQRLRAPKTHVVLSNAEEGAGEGEL